MNARAERIAPIKRIALGKLNWVKRAYAVFVLCAAVASVLPAQTFTTLHSFNGTDGSGPSGLVQAIDGTLYGTTYAGGSNCLNDNNGDLVGCGTVFKITPLGTLTTLYSFCSQSNCTDGAYPSGLAQATNGDFYGTTFGGGANDVGTVFKFTPSGSLTTLYSFCSHYPDCTDGENPMAGLAAGTDGTFYGTTNAGGANEVGTVFEITPGGALTTLYSFCAQGGYPDCPDGENPQAGLVRANNGDFYGTTYAGGFNCTQNAPTGCGTVFKITPSGTLTTLYNFCSQTGCTDGYGSQSALVQGADGNFYGTTEVGGAVDFPVGTVFKITTSDTSATLYRFCSQGVPPDCTDGSNPYAGLVQGTDGNLYGTTNGGGANGVGANERGTVFKITPYGTLTTLYSFCSQTNCTDGAYPYAGLVQDTDGNFYGTTSYTVFRLSLGLAPFVETLPTSGNAGAAVQILGTNLSGATGVAFNGTAAAFTVISPSLISTTVPSGASTGEVQVATPSGRLLSNVAFLVPVPASPFTVALSTAGQVEPFAAQSIVSAYGANLAAGTASASSLPIPTSLDGTTVTVTDSAGAARMAPLFYVSPSQINFEIPASSATGMAAVSIQSQSAGPQTSTIQIGNVSPGLFELNGSGLVAAWVLPVISGIQQPLQPVYQLASGIVVPLPINLGPSTERIYLEMYGTGIRNSSSVTATVGGLNVPVLYAGPAPGFAGEDQVNIGPIPQSLAGAGSVNIVLTAGGQAANTVNATIQ